MWLLESSCYHCLVFGPSLWVVYVNVCLERKGVGKFWVEASAGYLPGSNKVTA